MRRNSARQDTPHSTSGGNHGESTGLRMRCTVLRAHSKPPQIDKFRPAHAWQPATAKPKHEKCGENRSRRREHWRIRSGQPSQDQQLCRFCDGKINMDGVIGKLDLAICGTVQDALFQEKMHVRMNRLNVPTHASRYFSYRKRPGSRHNFDHVETPGAECFPEQFARRKRPGRTLWLPAQRQSQPLMHLINRLHRDSYRLFFFSHSSTSVQKST